MKRILVISNLFPPHYLGGHEIECEQVCRQLMELGYVCEVWTSDFTNKPSSSSHAPHIKRTLKLSPSFGEKDNRLTRQKWAHHNRKKVAQGIRAFNPDVIFVWSQLRLTGGPLRAVMESGYPYLMRFGDTTLSSILIHPSQGHLTSHLRHFAEKYCLSSGKLHSPYLPHVSCISHCLYQEMLSLPVQMGSRSIEYRGIHPEQFPFQPQMAPLHSRPLRLLYVGQLHPYKGVHTTIQSAHQRASWGHAVHLSIVGAGDPTYEKQLRNLAKEGKATISFQGKVPYNQLSEVYRSHDLLLFPSIWKEPQGATYLEAMASGLPVLSTATGGQGEILKHTHNAMIFEASDPHSLCEQMDQIVEDEELREKIITQGRQEVEKTYSFQQYTQSLEKRLIAIASGAPHGR